MPEVIPMIPASAKALWLPLGLVVLMLALSGLFGFIAYSSRNVRFEISSEGIRIRGDLWGRSVSASALIPESAQSMNLNERREYRPRWRTGGTGMPGYRAGWFKLRNGEKSLVFVTDPTSVVYLPTRDGYSMLLSVSNQEGFLRAVRRLGS